MNLMIRLTLLVLIPISSWAIVDMKNANVAITWLDLRVPGQGYDLRIQRTYNSRSLFNGIFGFGQCSDFETKINITPENTIKLTECGSGLQVMYNPKNHSSKKLLATLDVMVKAIKKKNPSYDKKQLKELREDLASDPRLREEIAKSMDIKGKIKNGKIYYSTNSVKDFIVFRNKKYIRTLPDGTKSYFNSKGQLTRFIDSNGNYLKLEYKGAWLATVYDNNGKKLNFKFNKKIGKVVKIVGPKGLKVTYEYKDEDLAKVVNAWNNTFTYDYDDLHNLEKITFPDKSTREYKYDKDKDWVVEYKNRKDCKETYAYEIDKEDPLNHYTSTVKKTCGKKVTNLSTYEFFHRLKPDGVSRYLWRAKSDNNGQVTDVHYHEKFGKPTIIIDNNVKIQFKYFASGQLKEKVESFRVTSFEYKNKCGKVSRVVSKYFEAPIPEKARKLSSKDKKKKAKKRVKKKIAKTISTKFSYDSPKCNLMLARNSEGQVAKLKYDKYGRIRRIEDQTHKIVKIKYDGRNGKPNIVTRPGLGTIKVNYKTNGEIAKIDSKEGPVVAVQVASIFNNLLDIIAPATSEVN